MNNIHRHSLDAYKEHQAGFLTNKHRIFRLLSETPCLTDKQIASRLGKPMASIQPRCSDLIREGIIVEDGECLDVQTGIIVRTLRIWQEGDPIPEKKIEAVEDVKKAVREYFESHKVEATSNNTIEALVGLGLIKGVK